MKTIQPIQIWNNGVLKTANTLSARIVSDNLLDTALFYYELCFVDPATPNEVSPEIANGNLTMTGVDYENWGNSGLDMNDEAYQWIADNLNLTIV